ncbi:hypothetical protein RA279_29550, partial [Pseudomonas syringae pv. tagetis]|uniref:hypothetical protein n=1 Tax=Pseudomonas syringae group genomosp. 7 TaxID=251699 RepID=UPI00376F96CF
MIKPSKKPAIKQKMYKYNKQTKETQKHKRSTKRPIKQIHQTPTPHLTKTKPQPKHTQPQPTHTRQQTHNHH